MLEALVAPTSKKHIFERKTEGLLVQGTPILRAHSTFPGILAVGPVEEQQVWGTPLVSAFTATFPSRANGSLPLSLPPSYYLPRPALLSDLLPGIVQDAGTLRETRLAPVLLTLSLVQ